MFTDPNYTEEIEKLTSRISELENENANLRLLDETITRNTAMFEALLENSSGGIALIGPDRRIVRLVRAAVGFVPGEVAGLALESILHPEDQGILIDCCNQLLNGSRKSVEFEGRVCIPDGSIRWVLARLTDMLDDPNVQAIVCNYADITAQKERELIMAEFAAIVPSTDHAIFSQGLDGRILTWNRGAEKLFGYSREEILGRHIRSLAPVELHDEELIVRERVRETAQPMEVHTVRVCKDGSRISVKLRLAPVLDRYGRPQGISHSTVVEG